VGTRPPSQRRGLAALTLAPVLEAIDRDGVPAFLETSSTTNVAFYERLGFHVAGHRQIDGGGPEVWAMYRPAAAASLQPSKRLPR
jgi:GNAT superfamily N-acetyltransferase